MTKYYLIVYNLRNRLYRLAYIYLYTEPQLHIPKSQEDLQMTYVMSDIHGNMRRFNSVMEQITLQPEDTLYILGDVIDRHPDGIRILRRIMEKPNIKMLLGNHEYMMLRAIGRPFDAYEKMDALLIEDQGK